MLQYGQTAIRHIYMWPDMEARRVIMLIVNRIMRSHQRPVPQADTIGCPICGRGNRAGVRFCQHCGTWLTRARFQVPTPLSFSIAARTDKGRVRRSNQDSIYTGELALPGGGMAYLCLVADGVGGGRAGEHASAL